MSDVQLAGASPRKLTPVPPPTPELDERLWQAWKQKNQAKDRVWATKLRRIIVALLIIAAVVALTATRQLLA